MTTTANRQQVLLAYRHLYKHCLQAVQYSKPARYIIRDRLRRLFHSGQPKDLDQKRVDNTLEFLRGAARHKGLEHRIVKNLIHVWFHEQNFAQSKYIGFVAASFLPDHQFRPYRSLLVDSDKDLVKIKMTAYDPLYYAIKMLNESMGMCIR